MEVNVDKTKIIHCKIQGHLETFDFHLGQTNLEIVNTDKYLGVVIDSSLSYDIIADFLAKSGGRALGSLCNKFK